MGVSEGISEGEREETRGENSKVAPRASEDIRVFMAVGCRRGEQWRQIMRKRKVAFEDSTDISVGD